MDSLETGTIVRCLSVCLSRTNVIVFNYQYYYNSFLYSYNCTNVFNMRGTCKKHGFL